MIEKMATALVHQMREEKLISKADEAHYSYALITMTEYVIAIGTILLIGLFVQKFIATICFLVFFLSLRKRTGGYHADKFWQCYLMTVITYILITQAAAVLCRYPAVMYIMLLLAVLIIEVIGTVNHPNMDMSSSELREAKRAARFVVLLEAVVITAAVMVRVDGLYVSYMSIAVILCAFLLCLAKIIKQEVK